MARHSIRSTEGELLVDHTNSPGLPSDFYRNIGLEGLNAGEGKKKEIATLTCCHCGTVFIKNPDRVRDRHHCKKCDAYVCDNPVCIMECKPYSKILDELQERAHRGLII